MIFLASINFHETLSLTNSSNNLTLIVSLESLLSNLLKSEKIIVDVISKYICNSYIYSFLTIE